MYLAVEIGGTKLQLAVGPGRGAPLVELVRREVQAGSGAAGIRAALAEAAPGLKARHTWQAVGCGFGGPIDVDRGRTLKSHHVVGWDDFPLVDWLEETFGAPAAMANDADTAGLAEARYGAGRGYSPVLYVTVGTGIGGGLIVDDRIYRGSGLGATEIGHLRPNLESDSPEENLESLAAGWGLAHQARLAIRQALAARSDDPHAVALLLLANNDLTGLTARQVAEEAQRGNPLAIGVFQRGVRALGWGLAQAITLLTPAVVVVGGGVSLVGEERFFAPLRQAIRACVFPPLVDRIPVVAAQLGEEVVLHGAFALAEDRAASVA